MKIHTTSWLKPRELRRKDVWPALLPRVTRLARRLWIGTRPTPVRNPVTARRTSSSPVYVLNPKGRRWDNVFRSKTEQRLTQLDARPRLFAPPGVFHCSKSARWSDQTTGHHGRFFLWRSKSDFILLTERAGMLGNRRAACRGQDFSIQPLKKSSAIHHTRVSACGDVANLKGGAEGRNFKSHKNQTNLGISGTRFQEHDACRPRAAITRNRAVTIRSHQSDTLAAACRRWTTAQANNSSNSFNLTFSALQAGFCAIFSQPRTQFKKPSLRFSLQVPSLRRELIFGRGDLRYSGGNVSIADGKLSCSREQPSTMRSSIHAQARAPRLDMAQPSFVERYLKRACNSWTCSFQGYPSWNSRFFCSNINTTCPLKKSPKRLITTTNTLRTCRPNVGRSDALSSNKPIPMIVKRSKPFFSIGLPKLLVASSLLNSRHHNSTPPLLIVLPDSLYYGKLRAAAPAAANTWNRLTIEPLNGDSFLRRKPKPLSGFHVPWSAGGSRLLMLMFSTAKRYLEYIA